MGEITKSELSRVFKEAQAVVPQSPEQKKNFGNDTIASMLITLMGDRLIWDKAIGAFWVYSPKGYYMAATDKDDMLELISGCLVKWGQKNTTVSKLEDIFKQTQLHSQRTEELDDRFVSFSDLLWSPETTETTTPSPKNIATLHVPMPFTTIKDAPSPLLDLFLQETCLDDNGNYDPGMANQLQEFAGYLLWPKVERCPCLFLYGEGHNGKSVYIDILKGLVGKAKTSSCGLEDLIGDKFGLVSLAGMRLNASDEMGNCREATTEKFKKMVVGDTVRVQRKFGNSFDMKPNCRFVFSTNTIPAFSEVNLAMRRRLLIIPFYRDLNPFDKEHRKKIVANLGHKIIKEELPGVVRWAMAGLERLKENQFWMTRTETSDNLMTQFEEASSSVIEFLHEFYEADPDGEFQIIDAYNEYVAWCKDVGRKAVSRIGLGKEFSAVFGKCAIVKRNGKTIRVYRCKHKSTFKEPAQNPFL